MRITAINSWFTLSFEVVMRINWKYIPIYKSLCFSLKVLNINEILQVMQF